MACPEDDELDEPDSWRDYSDCDDPSQEPDEFDAWRDYQGEGETR